MIRIAIIGAGNMGGAIARGLAETGNFEVCVSNPSVSKLEAIRDEYPNVKTTHSNTECADRADVVILAVKPWKIEDVIREIRPVWEKRALPKNNNAGCACCYGGLLSGDVTLVSLAAGIDIAGLREMAGEIPAIYKAIPNTAVSVKRGVTFISRETAYEDLDETISFIFSSMGSVEIVEERMLDAGMAVASCGMAFMMRMLRAMTEGGVELGLYPATALRAAAATMRGAAELIERGGLHPEQEVDKVTTPGGITIRGLNAMEEAGFTGAVVKGLRACKP